MVTRECKKPKDLKPKTNSSLKIIWNSSTRLLQPEMWKKPMIFNYQWIWLSSSFSTKPPPLISLGSSVTKGFICLHSFVPSYFSLYFTRFSNIHNYSLLSLPNVKQNGKRTFLFTGAKIVNKLPLKIVKSENIQKFCRRARHFFLS